MAVRPQELPLLRANAGWILAADPEAGLEALLSSEPPLPHTLVTPILEV